jgi:hypothetical protein
MVPKGYKRLIEVDFLILAVSAQLAQGMFLRMGTSNA